MIAIFMQPPRGDAQGSSELNAFHQGAAHKVTPSALAPVFLARAVPRRYERRNGQASSQRPRFGALRPKSGIKERPSRRPEPNPAWSSLRFGA